MQYIDNDMDELFRRAAENYPLRTAKGNWESVAERFSGKKVSVKKKKSEGKNTGEKFILPFLLLTGLLFGWFMIHDAGMPHSALAKGKNIENDPEIQSSQPEIKNNNVNEPLKNFEERSTARYFSEETPMSSAEPVENVNEAGYAVLPLIKKEIGVTNKKYAEINKEDFFMNSNPFLSALKNPAPEITGGLFKKTRKEEASVSSAKQKGLYIGLSAGPDFSKVKSGKLKGPGHSIGLLLGFQANSKLSFETGLFSHKKIYNSEGVFFSIEKIRATMPNGMIINNLEGQSNLLEIPLKAKYDFNNGARSNFFIMGGASAYIVTKEKNKYNVTMNGNPEKMEGTYQKNNYKFPAVASISIGYEFNLSGLIKLRAEPYIKIPLQGIGVGNLPVTSAGLQIGITRRMK